jgi:CheY-like chemotaxis protein
VEPRGTILVVDDDDDLRQTFAGELSSEGYEVAEARHGAEALDYLQSHPPPDAIFLDLMMPVMDGVEFLNARGKDREKASIPVFVFTARGDIPWTLPVQRIFRKPLDLPRVLEALDAVA